MSSDKCFFIKSKSSIHLPADRHSQLCVYKARLHLDCCQAHGHSLATTPIYSEDSGFQYYRGTEGGKSWASFSRSFAVLSVTVILQPNPGFMFLQQRLATIAYRSHPAHWLFLWITIVKARHIHQSQLVLAPLPCNHRAGASNQGARSTQELTLQILWKQLWTHLLPSSQL